MAVVDTDNQGAGARILVVDDDASVRRLLCKLLERNGYSCAEAADANEANSLLDGGGFHLLLTDLDMPGESGLQLIRSVSSRHPDLATVMITGLDDTKLANSALELGAYGYIIKPFEANEIIINVRNALRRRSLEIENRGHQQRLEQLVKERTSELWSAITDLETTQENLRQSREETVERLSIAAEFRDDETGRHVQRMSRYCALLARALGHDSERSELIRIASQMHDIGKLGIPDRILRKPGSLDAEERTTMETHCEIGWRILSGSSSQLLTLGAVIARSHHERVDGSGYPHGLMGEDIPQEGRIAAIADVFDALTTERVYRSALPLGQALDIMRDGRGTHFDVTAFEGFFGVLDEALRIQQELPDY
ncbi:MAG: response regulator [Actinomycetota bacterium]|nr:response regulator [Actinomycetota bacterium]